MLDHIDGIALRARWAAEETFSLVNDEAVLHMRTASGAWANPVWAIAFKLSAEALAISTKSTFWASPQGSGGRVIHSSPPPSRWRGPAADDESEARPGDAFEPVEAALQVHDHGHEHLVEDAGSKVEDVLVRGGVAEEFSEDGDNSTHLLPGVT